jgi:hypothetical protein
MAMILESADRSQRFPLDRETTFVGSSEWKSDICLTGSDIADVHCELTLDEQGVRVVALVDCGVTVNGQTVHEASLSAGDELGIALLKFRLTGEDADASDSSSGQHAAKAESVAPHLSRWVVRMSGMNLGPLDWDELETMIGRGEVRLDDEVQREDETTWQPLRDVLPQSGGDGLLCDDGPDEPVDFVPHRRRSGMTSPNEGHNSEQAESPKENSFDVAQDADDNSSERVVPLAPQFFIRRGDEEVGPLPRQAIQELADEGSVLTNTPVRLEEAEQWSTAAAVGFHCQAAEPAGPSAAATAESKAKHRATGILWIVFAPYYFVSGVAATIEKIDPRRAAKWGAAIVVAGFLAFGWFRSWSQTAMRGVVTVDGQPVSEVLVQLTGASTGDSAMGVSDGQGNFRVVTLDGELRPGLYLVTVRPWSEVSGHRNPNSSKIDTSTPESNLPERYRHLNTTDATIEITAEQSHYPVALTTKPRSISGEFRNGNSSSAHSLP